MIDYMPSTKKDIDGMYQELLVMIQKTKGTALKKIGGDDFCRR